MQSREGKRPATIDEVVRVPAADAAGESVAMRRPPRIDEVARLAGVSPITVSRALRHPDKVAEKSRRRILQIVEQTGYASNPHARALRSGQSTIVAAFVSNILSQQFGLAVQGCAEVLEPHGYQLLVGQTSYSYATETSMVQSLRALRPAAVMFTGVIELEQNRRALRELGIPVMETWAYPRDPIDMLVGFSNMDGGRMAAAHLAERGYGRIAFIGRRGGRGALRLAGFREESAARGLDLATTLTVESVKSVADGRKAFNELLDLRSAVQAVFCANDLLAIGALFEARKRGMRVPQDIAILGFGDSDIADETSPGLTTIAIDSRALGHRAGTLLLERLTGQARGPVVELVDIVLMRRGST